MWGVTRNDHLARAVLSICTLHLPEFQQEFYWQFCKIDPLEEPVVKGSYYYSPKDAEALNMNHYIIGRDGFRSESLALVTITKFSLYTSQEAHHSGANPAFLRMKRPGVFLLPPG